MISVSALDLLARNRWVRGMEGWGTRQRDLVHLWSKEKACGIELTLPVGNLRLLFRVCCETLAAAVVAVGKFQRTRHVR